MGGLHAVWGEDLQSRQDLPQQVGHRPDRRAEHRGLPEDPEDEEGRRLQGVHPAVQAGAVQRLPEEEVHC